MTTRVPSVAFSRFRHLRQRVTTAFRHPKGLPRSLLVLGFVAFPVVACDRADDTFATEIIERHKAGHTTVRLGDLTKFQWDRMCYYGPYMWSNAYSVDNGEHEWVVLFFRKDEVVGRTARDRSDLEIVMGTRTPGDAPCFPPDRIGHIHTERGIAHLTLSNGI
ncbi:MAG: hypothetical protein P8Z76_17325 [Alphaproteobacteria bacterium]|jgi:hypothetical protein